MNKTAQVALEYLLIVVGVVVVIGTVITVSNAAVQSGKEGLLRSLDDFWNNLFGIGRGGQPQPLPFVFCSDSDGGLNYLEKGTVETDKGNFTDACNESDNLIEYYCMAEQTVASQVYSCPSGEMCNDGACVPIP